MNVQTTTALLRALLPQLAAVAVTYILAGAALASVPLFVARDLGLGPVMIGLLTGASFLVSIAARLWAGGFSDRHGPRLAVLTGLALTVAAGLFGLGAAAKAADPTQAATLLVMGRALLGGAEGIAMVAAQTWALSVAGPKRAALVVGWVGTAMFGGMALGAPLGGLVYAGAGFSMVSLIMAFVPLPLIALFVRMHGVAVEQGARIVVWHVARRIAVHCLAMVLAGFGFGAITGFSVLLFEERAWRPEWLSLTLFSIALIVTRIFLGGLPDRLGGIKAALISLGVMAVGFALMGFSPVREAALIGAFLSGLGYALVYPAIAQEALRTIPTSNRGSAMAVFSSSVNLVLAIGGPFLGVLAKWNGSGAVFIFAAAMAGVSAVIIGGFFAKSETP